MRNPFRRPRGFPEMETMRAHELVRDFPELLPFLFRRGISLAKVGAETLPAPLLHSALETLEWRRPGGE